jgi:hypothetical protein
VVGITNPNNWSKEMKAKIEFGSICMAVCVLVLFSLPSLARSADPPQSQSPSTQTQSAKKDEKQTAGRSPGKEIGKGAEDVGKGAGKGAANLGKGTAEGAGNLATLHPGKAAADLGKGVGDAGKDVGVGTGKGAAKIGKGSAKGIGKLSGKIFHRGNKNKEKSARANTSATDALRID